MAYDRDNGRIGAVEARIGLSDMARAQLDGKDCEVAQSERRVHASLLGLRNGLSRSSDRLRNTLERLRGCVPESAKTSLSGEPDTILLILERIHELANEISNAVSEIGENI